MIYIKSSRKNSLRLKCWDYRSIGPYFITICLLKRKNLFIETNLRDDLIKNIKIVGVDLSTQIHCFVIAVDHIHLIISLPDGKIISLYKFVAIVKVRITQFLIGASKLAPTERIWQRSYYDHIIRDEKDFLEKTKYIEEHPIKEDGSYYAEWH